MWDLSFCANSSVCASRPLWDLRVYHHTNGCLAAFGAVFTNLALIVWLLKEKSRRMQLYRRILIRCAVFDLIYTAVCKSVELQTELKGGVLFLFVNGFLSCLPLSWHYFMVWSGVLVVLMAVLLIPVEFFYRFMLICRNRVLNRFQLSTLSCVAFAYSAFESFLFVLAAKTTPDEQRAQFDALLSDSHWNLADGQKSVFIAAHKDHPVMRAFVVCVVSTELISFIVIAYLIMVTSKKIRRLCEATFYDVRIVELHMNRFFLVKAILNVFLSSFWVAVILIFIFFDLKMDGLGITLTMLIAWIPTINALSTFVLTAMSRNVVPVRRHSEDMIRIFSVSTSTSCFSTVTP
ncbi:hypothetical protein AAVH_09255 [Aphelenchoides avenae]|nr:hypothetical protein AAVH_09255 [Aphelenchus avenae]